MKALKEFVSYIRENRKKEVVERIAELCELVNDEIASFIPSKNNLLVFLEARLDSILILVESDNIPQLLTQQIAIWPHQSHKRTPEVVGLANQLLLFSNLFKTALFECIPGYTNEVGIATGIIIGLENQYYKVETLSLKRFREHGINLQDELKETEERFKDLFDNAHDLVHFVNADGTIMHVNKAWQQTLHYPIEEIEGKSIYNFVEETDREQFITYRKRILNNQSNFEEIKVRLKTNTGEIVFVEGRISPKLVAGKVVYTRGIFRNITARIENEESINLVYTKLREREENLQQLVTYAPDAIIAINDNSLITYWNPKAEEIFGWSSNEVLNRSLAEVIIPAAYRQEHEKGMKRYLATGEARVLNKTIEVTAINKNGNEFYVSLTISSTKQSGNIGFISFIRDITQQKKNVLELEQSKKQLDESNRELEQYSWLTSHDLMEPLRKILTYSDILLTQHNDKLEESVQKHVAKIHQSGKRMGSLIQAILSYSELASEQHLFEKVNLNLIVEEVLVDLELLIKNANAEIEIKDLKTIEAIPFQMRQMFQNLIANAVKYARKDVRPQIQISSCEISGFLEIIVKDNGIGFEQKDQDKIFRLFQRLAIEYQTDGTGIGLALCKKIVEKHNGSISAESQPGKGTSFFIKLPIKQQGSNS